MSVAPAVLEPALRARSAGGGAFIRAVDVDAASEANLPVDDDDLAMIAVLHLPDFRRLHQIQRPELADFDVLRAQAVEELGRCVAAAEAVVKHTHFDALLALL